MARFWVDITPDDEDGSVAYLEGGFSGGSESYSYAKRLYVVVLGDSTYTIESPETSGGSNTFSKTITGLTPNTYYSWRAELLVRVTGGWGASGYETNGNFTTAPPAAETYYATLSFNANGGSGAPSKQYESEKNTTGYVQFTIPSTRPSKSGYVFAGWTLDSGGTGKYYSPGGSITLWSGDTSYPGTGYTLYAQWTEDTSGYVWLYTNGAWQRGILWVSNGTTYRRGIPWVYRNSAWRRGA